MLETHLVIGDQHVLQNDDLIRFYLLNKLIKSRRPKKIIFMGDLIEMESLSTYTAPGSKEKENLRLQKELSQASKAIKITLASLPKTYKPDIYFCEGNHEYRLQRFFDSQAVFDGIISLPKWLESTLGKINATWIPYGRYQIVDGILYTHVPMKGGRPVSSVANTTGTILQQVDTSIISAHTHRLEFKQARRAGTFKLISALTVGCFFEHTPKYVEKSHPPWWRGVVMLNVFAPGEFDFETISLTRMREEFGEKN